MISSSTTNLLSILNENKLLILRNIYLCNDKICNCDISRDLKISKHLISYHIRTLRQKDFLIEEKCGKYIRYKINPQKEKKVRDLLKILELI